jgi:hypothetical protein
MIGIDSSATAKPGQENASPPPRHKLQPEHPSDQRLPLGIRAYQVIVSLPLRIS